MATLIRQDGSSEVVYPKGKVFSLEELQHLVGGYIELIVLPNGLDAYINEDGKELLLPVNNRATTLLQSVGIHPHDYVVGNLVVCTRQETEEEGGD